MKKLLCLLMCAVLSMGLVSCGGSAAPVTEKSAELKAQYGFYENSVKQIISKMKVTPEQADDIFTTLVSTGINEVIVKISDSYGEEGEYKVDYSGLLFRTVKITDGVVSEITYGSQTLYPLELTDEYLIENATLLIEGLSSNSSRSDYESAQSAYDSLSKNLKKQISENLVNKLHEYNVSTMAIESAVDSSIEKARAEKERVSINDNLGTGSGKIVLVYLKGKDNLSINMIKTGMLIESCDILQYLQPREEMSEITIFWSFPLVDNYGNTKDETVLKINFDKATLDKINFDNFDYNKIPDIANDCFIHLALSN